MQLDILIEIRPRSQVGSSTAFSIQFSLAAVLFVSGPRTMTGTYNYESWDTDKEQNNWTDNNSSASHWSSHSDWNASNSSTAYWCYDSDSWQDAQIPWGHEWEARPASSDNVDIVRIAENELMVAFKNKPQVETVAGEEDESTELEQMCLHALAMDLKIPSDHKLLQKMRRETKQVEKKGTSHAAKKKHLRRVG